MQNTTSLTIDYNRFCYCLEISSDEPIVRVDMKGDIELMESPTLVAFQNELQVVLATRRSEAECTR